MSAPPASLAMAASERKPTPIYAKTLAAATGATLTALTMTPFDVIKTRLQTQPPHPSQPSTSSIPSSSSSSSSSPLSRRLPPDTCCRSSAADCVRKSHSLALSSHHHSHRTWTRPRPTFNSAGEEIVCLWDGTWTRAQRVNGFWDAAWKVWSIEGVAGLWKGVGTTLAIAVPSQTIYMLTYDSLLNNILPNHTLTPLFAGALARTLVTASLSPLELLRTRLQSTPSDPANSPHTLRSTLTGIRSMVRSDGVKSLWRGLGSTLWRDVPFSAMYWIGYENSKKAWERNGYQGPGVAFVSGATSGMASAIVTSPFDVIKTRRQALIMGAPGASSLAASTGGNTGTLSVATHILRTEGYKTLFAGLTPRLAKIAPACGIMISCYDGFSKYLSR